MKASISIVLFLTTGLTVLSQPVWKEYIFDKHDFKIDFCGRPEYSVDSSVFNQLKLGTCFWEVKADDPLDDNIYYSVSRAVYPSEFIHSDSLPAVVDGFISSTQSSLTGDENFTLLSSSLAEKHGYQGKIFKWESNSNNVFLEFHVYLVKNVLFELSVVTREGKKS